MSLTERDALLSRLLGQEWPHEPLLNAVNLPRHLDVLDVGAGAGKLLNFLSSTGHTGQLIGVDPHPGAGAQPGEAENLPFPSPSFDVVFMVRMLTHCTNPVQAIREARRVLRSGGQIIIAVHGKQHLQNILRGVPARGPEDDVQDILQLAGLDFRRQDVKRNIPLILQDACTMLNSYGKATDLTHTDFPLLDTLHLTIFNA